MAAQIGWRTRHLFVSSTFGDMHAERDHLRQVVFPELERRLRARRVHLQIVDLRWGVETLSLEEQAAREAEVLRYCLDEVERCRPFMLVLLGERYGHVPDPAQLPEVARRLGRDPAELRGRSVTELEIEAGVFVGTAAPPAFRVFIRQPLDEAGVPAARLAGFSDRAAGRDEAAAALTALKERLRALAPGRSADYRAHWDPRHDRLGGLDAFGAAVLDALWADLDAATASRAGGAAAPSALQRHQSETEELLELRGRSFVGRAALLERLERFCLGRRRPFAYLLTGASGAGKTSLMASLAGRLAAAQENAPLLLAHFLGEGSGSGEVDGMLRVFGELLADACGEPRLAEDADHARLVEGFAHLLGRVATRRQVVLLLDGLDRIEPTAEARGMGWLPLHRPRNLRVVASAIDGPEAQAFAARTSAEPMALPALAEHEGRALVERLCALEHRRPNPAVVDALLRVPGPGGRSAAANPLWLGVAVGQLNRLQGAEFVLASARLERRADARLVGYLADWAAQLPGDSQALFGQVLQAAEAHFGVNARHLARALAVARNGWRQSDLLGILAQLTGRPWQDLGLVGLRHALHGALIAGPEGLWRFAHDRLASAVVGGGAPDGRERELHAAVMRHLLGLPPDDPIRRRELAHHALGAGEMSEAARALAIDGDEEDERVAVDVLVARSRTPPAGEEAEDGWQRRLLWAQGLAGGARLRLAQRLQAAGERLARGQRWRACREALSMLPEFYRANAGGLLERREATFQQARVVAGLGACARALGELEAAAEQMAESGRLAMTLVGGVGQAEFIDPAAATEGARMFHRPPSVDRMALWCDLAVQCPCAIAEVLMELGQFGDASFVAANAMILHERYPAALRDALAREQPLRVKGSVALTSAWHGLVMLFYGSGHAAFGDFHQAQARLSGILDFVPRSLALRREWALVAARSAQALKLAGAPGASVRSAVDALRTLNRLCREQPGLRSLRFDRAFALRCLADGWDSLGQSQPARWARILAARDLGAAIDEDADSDSARRSLAWARGQPGAKADLASLLGCPLPGWDYQRPRVWTSNQAEAEAKAWNPEALAQWRTEVLDGPRFGDWLPAIRIANFALRRAFEQHGREALTEETMRVTPPRGGEFAVRDLKPGIAKAFGIDGEAMLAALQAAAGGGAPDAQKELGTLCLDGVFGAELELEGLRWLRAAARAGSHPAALRLGEQLLSVADDPEAWRQGAELLRGPAEAGDPRALARLASVHFHGRGAGKDPAQGLALLQAAAQRGDLGSAYNLGVHLETGQFVPQDRAAARSWYEQAAAGGYPAAWTNLGIMLLAQGGDLARAEALLEQACDSGDTLAMAALAGLLARADPTPERLARARSLLEAALRAGRNEARYLLGFLLAGGLGGPRDLEGGLKLMSAAAADGDLRAAMVLGVLGQVLRSWPMPDAMREQLRSSGWTELEVDTLVQTAAAYREHEARDVARPVDPDDPQALYERGVHLSQQARPPDFPGAFRCYSRAAGMGHAEAAYNLGYLYLNGEGVERDVVAGLGWMRRAAETGRPEMQYELGVLLSEGVVTAPDPEQAAHWYRRAADQGFAPAIHNFAWCHLQGKGVERDPEAALALFRKAAAAGLLQSAAMVAKLEGGG